MRSSALLTRSLALLITLTSSAVAHAQGVAINPTGAAADGSAMLDVSSTTKGLLPPRMTAAQRAAITSPATGLVVFQTDGAMGLYYNAGSPAAPSWQIAGAGAVGQWSVNGTSLYYSGGNVGIGRNPPLAPLDVLGGNCDLAGTEGDFRIGNGVTRLKFGIATGGGGNGAATIMEQGPAGAYNVLSLGTQGNKVLHVNGATQRVGIGTDAPTAPLGFPPTVGKKIALYSGATGDYGFGIASGRLQISAEAAGTDVAIGSDAGGTFTERLAVKNTGAIAVNGSTGAAGQVLQSRGGAAPAAWVGTLTYANIYDLHQTSEVTTSGSYANFDLPGLVQGITLGDSAKVIVSLKLNLYNPPCVCLGGSGGATLYVDSIPGDFLLVDMPNGTLSTLSGTIVVRLGPGTHDLRMKFLHNPGDDIRVLTSSSMTLQVVPK